MVGGLRAGVQRGAVPRIHGPGSKENWLLRKEASEARASPSAAGRGRPDRCEETGRLGSRTLRSCLVGDGSVSS